MFPECSTPLLSVLSPSNTERPRTVLLFDSFSHQTDSKCSPSVRDQASQLEIQMLNNIYYGDYFTYIKV